MLHIAPHFVTQSSTHCYGTHSSTHYYGTQRHTHFYTDEHTSSTHCHTYIIIILIVHHHLVTLHTTQDPIMTDVVQYSYLPYENGEDETD